MQETWNKFLRNLNFGQYENQIPGPLMEQMFQDLEQTSVFRRYSLVLRTSKQCVSLPSDINCEYGISWTSEGEKKPTGKWEKLDIQTYRLQSHMVVTNDLLDNDEDAMVVHNIVYNRVIKYMTNEENRSFLYGNGKTQPKGLLSSLDKVESEAVEIEEGRFPLDSFIGGIMKLDSIFKQDAIWLVNKKFMNYLLKQNTKNLFLSGPNIYQKTINFLNLPVYVMDHMKDEHLCVLVDLNKAYCIIEKSDLTVFKDPYSQKPNIEFFFSKCIGGSPINYKALRLFKTA